MKDNAEAIFTWDYEKGARPALNKLYEKAKDAQWNGETDLPWDTRSIRRGRDQQLHRPTGRQRRGRLRRGRARRSRSGPTTSGSSSACESNNWALSQFMHGEQGALLCTAKIVETVPWIDAKYYAATQVMDEARHVEVFAKYLDRSSPGTTRSTPT